MPHTSSRTALRDLMLSCAVVLLAAGCDTRPHKPTPKPRGVGSAQPTEREVEDEDDDTPKPAAARVSPPPSAATPEPIAEEKPKQEPVKRDFSAELLGQMTGAMSCLGPRPSDSALRSIDVSLSALVGVTGRVSRGEARSAVLDAQELACMRARVEGARFALPIEPPPPFSVQATLHFDRAPQAPSSAPAAPTAPTPGAGVPSTY